MTAARLREIASHLESVCIERRKLLEHVSTPCETCKQTADELRELALQMSQAQKAVA